jgi:outer membrane protein assembly factor BamE (lipoprotein component of BamABCDE complex)
MVNARSSLPIALAAAIVLTVGASGCTARKEVRGNYLTAAQLSTIQVGTTNRQTVMRVLGPPSTEGTFDKQVWYYIGRQTEEWAFLEPEVLEQRVVAIYFDDKGVVEHMERYGQNDARAVDIVERETPTSGHKIGFFEQILGNLGVFGTGAGG